jgi:LmbE family N-acetylglucosaminyl deacetylase
MARMLIVDRCLDKRLATELSFRGRNAWGAAHLQLPRLDDDLLDHIVELNPEAVLLTSDDDMPAEHRATLLRTNLTVAIIDPIVVPPYTQAQWPREVVHRWTHRIEEQARGTIRRYGLANLVWTDRKRRPTSVPTPGEG